MLKQLFHKIASIALTVVLLLSTVSFAVESHYCGDVLIDFSLLGTVEKCGVYACDIPQEHLTKKSCCEDTMEVVTGQNQLSFRVFDGLNCEQEQLLMSYDYEHYLRFTLCSKRRIPHKNYRPPNLITNKHIWDQVFLI